MRALKSAVVLLLAGCAAASGAGGTAVSRLPALPQPVSNNAVVSVESRGEAYVVSFAGLGAGRGHEDTLDVTYVFSDRDDAWAQAGPVPGGVGRLAAVAAAAGELAYVFGGYTVDADGEEVSTPWVHAFDPSTGLFVGYGA